MKSLICDLIPEAVQKVFCYDYQSEMAGFATADEGDDSPMY
jgi:hypothetical protein